METLPVRIWVIADTHFNHAKMVEYEGRPPDFTERIIANWQALVAWDDVVFHLGDVLLGRSSELAGIMARLPGRKILCLGNHDRHDPVWFMASGFALACEHFLFEGVLFSHKPVTPLPAGARLNVHGHFHRGEHREKEFRADAYFQSHRDRYRLVQIEETLAPVRLETVLSERLLPSSGPGGPHSEHL